MLEGWGGEDPSIPVQLVKHLVMQCRRCPIVGQAESLQPDGHFYAHNRRPFHQPSRLYRLSCQHDHAENVHHM